tara:strand:+ start:485 stop:1051 length:567 start_codon:yes stop_codon:yes gene_type:complete
MRIISGSAKGKKILHPVDKKTRPLKDMVRESIFNILTHSNLLKKNLKDAIILDLFSGVGSFGLEAISRGSKKVVFFENYTPSISLLEKNIENLSFHKEATIINENIYNENIFESLTLEFDLLFIDPPFKDNNVNLLIESIVNSKIIHSQSLVILHRKKNTIEKLNKNFVIKREELYGSSKIVFGYFNR